MLKKTKNLHDQNFKGTVAQPTVMGKEITSGQKEKPQGKKKNLRQKEKPPGKKKNLSVKRKTSLQKEKDSRQKE